MFVYKKLKASDAGITAFEAHKEYTSGEVYFGRYSSSSKDSYSQFNLNNELEYFQLDHLFYKDPIFKIGNLNGGINYIDQEKRLYEKAAIVSISQNKFGSAIQKGTVNVDSTYIDDSKGNLYNNSTIINNYPTDKERVLYLGPVKGFKRTDLNRDLTTGELLVNPPTSYNNNDIDDSLYTNPVKYISCSIEHFSDLNCTGVQLENGYVKIPHSTNYNFGEEDFSITFYYKTTNASEIKYLLSKGGTQTVVKTPGYNTDGSIKGIKPPVSKPNDFYSLQESEQDAGKAFPFEIIAINNTIDFSRSDQNILSKATSSAVLENNTLYHIACIKTGSDLQIYVNGNLTGSDSDNTDLCKNQADLFIGTNPNISQNKLDSTSEGLISQLMVWNRGLTETEISNVSESIDGTPYVGNVFYENGMITFTSPKVNNNFATVTSTTNPFSLLPTSWVEGTTTTQNVTFTTFTGSFTFFNEENNSYNPLNNNELFSEFGSPNPTMVFPNGLTVETTTSNWALTSTPPTTIGVISTLNKLILGGGSGLTLNPITSSTNILLDSYTELLPYSFGISGSSGVSLGELGTDGDSTTLLSNPFSANQRIGFYLGENQTVTESINILFASNSQEIITENFPSSDTSIDDTVFDITGTAFGSEYVNLVSDDGLYIKATEGSDTPWWSGSLSMTDSASFTGTTEQYYISMDASNYSAPPGVTAAADYVTASPLGHHYIEILEDIPDTVNFFYNIRVKDFNPSFGETYTFKVRLYEDGVQYLMDTFNGTSIFASDGVDGIFTVPVNPTTQLPPQSQSKWHLSLELDTSDSDFPNGGGNDAKYIIDSFGIEQEANDVFPNELRTRTTIDTELSSIYHISCSDIAPNGPDPDISTDFYGLNTDVNGNTMGVKALLWKKLSNSSTYQLVTQSFYVSSSYSNASNNDFTYSHLTNDTTSETLTFELISDTAENTVPSSTSDLASYDGALTPISASFGISGSFTVTEISGSNILKLNSGLSDLFTSSENVSSQVIFGDTTNLIGNTTSPVNILGFVNDDNTQLQVDGIYLATSSFDATASLDRGNYISGSASIDISDIAEFSDDDFGIYFVDSLKVRTNTLGTAPLGISSEQKLQVLTKVNNTILDTRYISGNIGGSGDGENIFNIPYELGALTGSDNISFEFTVVSGSSNDLSAVTKDQGFSVDDLNIRRITSSNQITLQGGGEFPLADEIDLLILAPFSMGGPLGGPYIPDITFIPNVTTNGVPNVSSSLTFNEDNDVATSDQYWFVTESIEIATNNAILAKNGPFAPLVEWNIFDYEPGKEYQIEVLGDLEANPDPIDNEGAAIRLLDNDGILLREVFIDTGANTLETTNDLDISSIRFDNAGTLKAQLFISGASSPLYPNGIISSSENAIWSDTPQINIRVRSGSTISSGDTVTNFTVISGSDEWIYNWTGEGINGEYTASTTSNTNIAGVTSSHTTYVGSAPGLDIGNFTISPDLNGGNLEVGTPLFITESSVISGSAQSTIEVLDSVTAIPINPFIVSSSTNPDDDVKEEWLGYTFEYTNPIGNEVETLTVTSINTDDNSITVNNGQGLFQVGTYDAQDKQDVSITYNTTTTSGGSVNFKNTHLIFENEFQCTVEEDEFNFTLNPSARKNKSINSGDLANFATGSNFKPYVTTIGLYNEEGELLVVGKLAQPIRMSDETDTTFVVRFDT